MIALTNTQRQLELDLASASTTTLKIVATFSDIRYSDQTKNAGTTLSTSNGVTDVIIVAAPGNGLLRLIESISVTNPSGNDTETVRIYYDENGTEYDIIKVDLAAGDQLYYEDNQGWTVVTSVGNLKVATATQSSDFGTVAVSGQSNVVSDVQGDTLTLAAGSNITLTTDAGTDTVTIATTSGFTLGTEQASTSGTAITFTGIPAGTKMVMVMLEDVSIATADGVIVTLGDAGGLEVLGYVGTVSILQNAAGVGVEALTTAIQLTGNDNGAAMNLSGILYLALKDSTNHTWTWAWGGTRTDTATVYGGAGYKDLDTALTQLSITSRDPSTFDAGSINISYSS